MENWIGVLLLLALIGLLVWCFVAAGRSIKKNKEAEGSKCETAEDKRENNEQPDEERGMWANIGGKCKALAAALCWLGIFGRVIYGIVLIGRGSEISNGDSGVITGIAVAIVGSFMSYLGSIGLYAIGEAAEKSAYVAKYIEKLEAEKKEKEQKVE